MAAAIDERNLGAWLLKCNPAVYDLRAAVAAGIDYVDSWSVRPGYRAAMMEEGQKALLWVSGDGRRMGRGIWGIGWVRGPVREAVPEDDDPGHWVDRRARGAVRLAVPLWIPVLEEPVTVEEIRAAGLTDLEVQRMPQGSNPSWVSKQQLAVLEHLLPDWP
ncbi:MAG TPA: EVE domain-containing protein [Nocardioides sp.]|nr:EVE domain-containing protein [Nocardioides sp.]